MITLVFNQPCKTPKGPATFIARAWKIETDKVTGEETIIELGYQVSRQARIDELSRDEIVRMKPIIREWSEAEIRDWLKRATYCRNEIYPREEVTA